MTNNNDSKWNAQNFLKTAFLKPGNNFNKIDFGERCNRLSNFLEGYTVTKPEGGASGAKVLLLRNENNKYTHVLKYFDTDESKKKNNNKYKFVRKNEIQFQKPITSAIKWSELKNVQTDSDLSYIRGIREVYLGKKFDEIQSDKDTKNNNRISSKIEFIGFLKNKKITINNNKKITISDKKETFDIYIPFTIQTIAKGQELKKLTPKTQISNDTNKKNQLDDILMYNILYELAKVIYKLYKIINTQDNQDTEIFVGCHRDLHPGNIFVDINDNKSVKITLIDFDLSITDTSNLTKNYRCTRNTLSSGIKSYVSKIIKTTLQYTKSHSIKIISSNIKKKWLSNDLLKNDTDLYQYYQYWNFFYDNIQSNMLKKFLEISMNNAIDKSTIKQDGYVTYNKTFFLETLISELYPDTKITSSQKNKKNILTSTHPTPSWMTENLEVNKSKNNSNSKSKSNSNIIPPSPTSKAQSPWYQSNFKVGNTVVNEDSRRISGKIVSFDKGDATINTKNINGNPIIIKKHKIQKKPPHPQPIKSKLIKTHPKKKEESNTSPIWMNESATEEMLKGVKKKEIPAHDRPAHEIWSISNNGNGINKKKEESTKNPSWFTN